MAGPGTAAIAAAWPCYVDFSGKTFGIDFANRRRPEQIDPGGAQFGRIFLDHARIGVEILVRPELRGVDENRNRHRIGAPFCLCDQFKMARMQRTHSGNQCQRLIRSFYRLGGSTQRGQAIDGLHVIWALVMADQRIQRRTARGARRNWNQGQNWHMAKAHHIVFANEKGGTGKSTTAIHVAVGLASRGARVACLDLDSRQRTLYRYLENRRDTMARRDVQLPLPLFDVFEQESQARLEEQIARLEADADFLIFDTPGRDDPYARFVATRANTLVTPINDSFIDFDLMGRVDAENFKVKKLSFYAELMWEARMARARADGTTIDWVVLRNRLHNMEARNQQRMTDAIAELSKRAGFRVVPGLNERVIYRELFPSGLTLVDKGHLGNLGTAHIVARQELRELVSALALPEFAQPQLV